MLFSRKSSLADMLANAPEIFAVFNTKLEYLCHTPGWCQLLNIETGNLVGKKFFDIGPTMPQEWSAGLNSALDGIEVFLTDLLSIQLHGQSTSLDCSIAPWQDDKGDVAALAVSFKTASQLSDWVALSQSITDRLERATKPAGLGVIEYDIRDQELYINHIGREIFELSELEFDRFDLNALESRLSDQSIEKFRALCAEPASLQSDRQIQLKINRRDGSFINIRLNAQPLFEGKYCVGFAAQFSDITHESRIADAVEETLLESEAALENLRDQESTNKNLFAVIGHELRNPAAAIKMLLEADGGIDAQVREELLESNIDQLLAVLDELRSVALPNQRLAVAMRDDSPYKLVQAVVIGVKPALSRDGIALEFEADATTHELCHFNVQGLRQILSNLLRNIQVHSGASNAWVYLKASESQKHHDKRLVTMIVEDNGSGIPLEHQGRIFESYYRVSEGRDGSGIGLNLCQQLADTLGGVLSYETRKSGGSRFTLHMILDQVQAAEASSVDESNSKKGQVHIFHGKRILFAEDNPTIRLVTENMLQQVGAKVVVTENGQDAVDLFESDQAFDIVLTDIFMPKLDGYGVVSNLRSQGFKGLIIGITGATVGEESDNLLMAGADVILNKPISKADLEQAVLGYL